MTKNNFLKSFNYVQKKKKKVHMDIYLLEIQNSHKNTVKNNSSLDIKY